MSTRPILELMNLDRSRKTITFNNIRIGAFINDANCRNFHSGLVSQALYDRFVMFDVPKEDEEQYRDLHND